jgi:hypothetical protein
VYKYTPVCFFRAARAALNKEVFMMRLGDVLSRVSSRAVFKIGSRDSKVKDYFVKKTLYYSYRASRGRYLSSISRQPPGMDSVMAGKTDGLEFVKPFMKDVGVGEVVNVLRFAPMTDFTDAPGPVKHYPA